ncbi:hypothetical protein R4575_16745 [Acinetobacter baumannii]|nr:hypothetical protein [Acinetobacter baumannii]
MTKLIWSFNVLAMGSLLVFLVPVLFKFNPICGIVLGVIFLKLFILSIRVLIHENSAEEWCEEASASPLLNNTPQNIVNLPDHPLHKTYTLKK